MTDKCMWQYCRVDEIDGTLIYDTICDSRFYMKFRLGGQKSDNYKFCPNCGKEIEEVKE